MGHFGLLWGFGFLIMQPIIGYGYLKGIRESAPDAFAALRNRFADQSRRASSSRVSSSTSAPIATCSSTSATTCDRSKVRCQARTWSWIRRAGCARGW